MEALNWWLDLLDIIYDIQNIKKQKIKCIKEFMHKS